MISRNTAILTRYARRARSFKDRRGVASGVILTLVSLGLLGGLIFVSGVVPIKASSGHFPVTEWFLQTGKERSVALHSVGIQAPALDAPDLALKGAGYFETGCRPCHGSPGLARPLVPRMMTPVPPNLEQSVSKWSPEALFYIVKHGIKFTGMPAWPSLKRDDEVWAMVAFLRKLPDLNKEGYRRLAQGDPPPVSSLEAPEGVEGIAPPPKKVLLLCARCHGYGGIARGKGAFPHLAGQSAQYLVNALHAYAKGNRHSGIMEPIAADLDSGTIEWLAKYYAASGRSASGAGPAATTADAEAIARGKAIAEQGIFEQRVASCNDCHSPQGRKHKDAYPLLAGQPADYLVLQLELFAERIRGGSDYAHLMEATASRLKPGQMRDVALYFASQPLPQPAAPMIDE